MKVHGAGQTGPTIMVRECKPNARAAWVDTVLHIADVHAINPVTQASTAMPLNITVLHSTDADANGIAELRITPLLVAFGNCATCDSLPLDGAEVKEAEY